MKYNLITKPLSLLADIQTGPFGSQLHKEDYVEFGTPIVTVEHLGNKRFTQQNLPYVSDNDKKRLGKYILQEGDIVFSRVGSVDRCSYVSNEYAGWMFSGRCLRIRPTTEIDPQYLYYFFNLKSTKQYVRGIATGATMPSINTRFMGEVPITYPAIEIQREIAEILGVIDNKIDLNNIINDNLQEQIRALFHSMFISSEDRFSWGNGTFSDLIDSTLGGDWGKESPTENNTEMVYCILRTMRLSECFPEISLWKSPVVVLLSPLVVSQLFRNLFLTDTIKEWSAQTFAEL